MSGSKRSMPAWISEAHAAESSVVLRYLDAIAPAGDEDERGSYRDWLRRTSVREGARVFPLVRYKGVDVHCLDETSRMHTGSLKSIDGCVSIARCKAEGYERIVCESGGNTGAALTEYGQRAQIETFAFVPLANLSLLDDRVFAPSRAHVIAVENRRAVKTAAETFARLYRVQRIPRLAWRYEASRFRGLFVLESLLRYGRLDWLVQTISAGFGPIGIYRTLKEHGQGLQNVPRFLGVQQYANCPMFQAWKQERPVPVARQNAERPFLSSVMYDERPETYGTYEALKTLLEQTRGDLTTVSHDEFDRAIEARFDGRGLLDLLGDNGVEVTMRDGDVVAKTGLISLVGTLKEIDRGTIATGSSALFCLTSGVSRANGQVTPDLTIPRHLSGQDQLERLLVEYGTSLERQP